MNDKDLIEKYDRQLRSPEIGGVPLWLAFVFATHLVASFTVSMFMALAAILWILEMLT